MLRRTLEFLVVSTFLVLGAMAQDTATIVGVATDPSGAAIPGAEITVSNAQKGFVRDLTTDSAGAYTAAKIPIGSYTVTAQAKGFDKIVSSGIVLTVGQTLRVDLQMRIGSGSQEVTVAATVAGVETETGTISDVITGSQVTQLNLNGRNFTNLATLIPGAAPGGYDPSNVGVLASSGISFNGAPVQYNSWEIDGTNNTDQGAGGTANMVYPNIDAIAEFRISTSKYDASYGKNAGALIEVVTKSGTTKFRGTMFEFLRNDALDANDWFANREILPAGETAPKTPLKRNDFGFTIGGPLFIPHHYNSDKTKTFFFWAEEWRKNRQGTIINQTVPTTRMREGDFSECNSASPNFNPVVASNCVVPVNPATNAPFPGDVVPMDPDGAALLKALIPRPNNSINQYTAANSLPMNFRDDIIRIDQNIGNKNSLFFRYIQDAFDQTYVPTLWSNANYDTVNTKWTSPSKSAVAHLTSTLRPNLMNEFVVSFSTDVNTVHQSPGVSSEAGSINKPSSWSASTLFPANASNPLIPGVSICGGLPFCAAESTGFDYFYWGPIVTFKDNAVWTRGKHNLKFGFYLQHSHLNQTTNAGSAQGMFSFSNSAPNSTGNALADMYQARIASYTEYGRVLNGQLVGGYPEGHWVQWDFEPYFQDDWHISSRLTLNLGVRYYLPFPYHDISPHSLDSTFVSSQFSPAAEAQLDSGGNLIPGSGHNYLTPGNGLVPCGTGGIRIGCQVPYRGGFAPRIGFAFDPTGSGKTAVRGGYGISYDVANGNEGASGFFGNPPEAAAPSVYNVNGYSNIGGGIIPPTGMTIVGYHPKYPSVQQFSLGVEHQFRGDNFVGVSYVGSVGRHIIRNRNMDQVPVGATTQNVPAFAGTQGCDAAGNCDVQQILINNLAPTIYFVPYRGYTGINVREWSGNSSYNSLQVNYRHRIGYGLTVQAAYTWSHTIDDVGNPGVNDYDLSRWKATSSLNQSQMLVFNYIYALPFFSHLGNGVARSVLGGWEVSGIATFRTGTPIDFGCGIAGLSSGVGGPVRCNSLGPLTVKKGVIDDPQFGPTATWFDPGVIGQITVPQLAANGQPGMFGFMGRNVLTGPGRNNWDLALLKNFAAPWFGPEKSSIQFRLETFNTFNHPQWNGVNAGCGSQTPAGQPCSGNENNLGNGEVSGAWPARIVQLGLKFVF
ncbi:MAG: hypothetical protein DMG57_20050 [Acidobacteria bacterium]|nr:MAG: hypothetical protein DMG57_20050 [Acidobacteriota bacterium]